MNHNKAKPDKFRSKEAKKKKKLNYLRQFKTKYKTDLHGKQIEHQTEPSSNFTDQSKTRKNKTKPHQNMKHQNPTKKKNQIKELVQTENTLK